MSATLINGTAQASEMLAQTSNRAAGFSSMHGRKPGLAVILAGEDPASQVYVGRKLQASKACGLASFHHQLAASSSEKTLLALIHTLNADNNVDGILVQLPLPRHMDSNKIIQAIDPAKDVDGFHPLNTGLLYQGNPHLIPCTALGCLRLLKSAHPQPAGMDALVIGRSNIVGRPLAALLVANHLTVTIAHSRSRHLAALARRSEVVFAAAGVPQLIKPDWIAPGATVIDIGIHRLEDAGRKSGYRLIGDVDPQVARVAGHLTPVPGGVGPMTVACLLANTLTAANTRAKSEA